jgi:hypothetical protein
MTPERERAWESVKALAVQWHIPSAAVSATLAALEEVEHVRSVVELAKALVDAKSGEARAVAIESLFDAVANLRASGR